MFRATQITQYGVAALVMDGSFPARRALRLNASRLAEHGNIILKEY